MDSFKKQAPRQCKQKTPWHGFQLSRGDVYGVDERGLYVARPYMYKGEMHVWRQFKKADGTTMWAKVRATAGDMPVLAEVWRKCKLTPPPNTSAKSRKYKADQRRAARAAQEEAENNGVTAKTLQSGVIRKGHAAPQSGHYSNCDDFKTASRRLYGDRIEINGRFVNVSDSVASYLDGAL